MYYLTAKDEFLPQSMDDDVCSVVGDVIPFTENRNLTDVTTVEQILAYPFKGLDLVYDHELGALWCYFNHSQGLSFGGNLINEIALLQAKLKKLFENANPTLGAPLRYLIWASRDPSTFSLGGDLAKIANHVSKGDKQGLKAYVRSGVGIFLANYENMDLPITTIALCNGSALGGGLEWCLSADIIAANRHANFGFPEISLGLFPNIGAYSLLQRRVGTCVAEDMILRRKFIHGEELHRLGLAELPIEGENAEKELCRYLIQNSRQFAARRAIFTARRKVERLTFNEVAVIADMWVDAAMELDDRSVQRLMRIAKVQETSPYRRGRLTKSAA